MRKLFSDRTVGQRINVVLATTLDLSIGLVAYVVLVGMAQLEDTSTAVDAARERLEPSTRCSTASASTTSGC